MIDEALISIKAGNGGDGCVSFLRAKYLPRGGPDGGDGGSGGDIVIAGARQLETLSEFMHKKSYFAPNGQPGQGARKTGRDGADLVIKVPLGTVVKTAQQSWEFTQDGQTQLICRGGKGGLGNVHFATPTNRAPREKTSGERTEPIEAHLSLWLHPDIVLIGLPNAGKSTLLAALTNAHPKIADYPFTTTEITSGTTPDKPKLLMTELPPITAGAHAGKGIGNRFLKHAQNARLLVFVLDATQEHKKALKILEDQVNRFDPTLLEKPKLVVLTKSDLLEGRPPVLKGAVLVSAHTKNGIPTLQRAIAVAIKNLSGS